MVGLELTTSWTRSQSKSHFKLSGPLAMRVACREGDIWTNVQRLTLNNINWEWKILVACTTGWMDWLKIDLRQHCISTFYNSKLSQMNWNTIAITSSTREVYAITMVLDTSLSYCQMTWKMLNRKSYRSYTSFHESDYNCHQKDVYQCYC